MGRLQSFWFKGAALLLIVVNSHDPQHVLAGDRSNIAGLGMGRTFTAISRGVDAIGTNPSNLAIAEDGTFTLTFFPIGVRLGADFFDYGLYRRYFTGVSTDSGKVGYSLTENDKEQILSRFSSTMGTLDGDMEIKLFSLSFHGSGLGSLGLSVTERMGAKASLAKDYLRFLFYGNPPGETYELSNTALRGWWLRNYSVTYARILKGPFGFSDLAVGVSAKLVHGFGYFDAEQKNSSFTTSSQSVVTGRIEYVSRRAGSDLFNSREGAAFTPFPAPSGTGWGFDVGMNAKVSPRLHVGISVTDFGSLRWTLNARERRTSGNFTIDNLQAETQRDSLESLLEGTEMKVNSFETPLPTAVHAGVSLRLGQEVTDGPPRLLLAMDYHQGFNDMPGNSRRPRISLGAELRPFGWLPVRSGISIGGSERQAWAFGLGVHLGPFHLDLATEDVISFLSPNTASRMSAGAGIRWSF